MNDTPQEPANQSKNRGEPAILLPNVILALLGLLVAIHVARTLVLNNQGEENLLTWLAFIPMRLTDPTAFPGGWLPLIWTPFTSALLHGGWDHLLLNCAWLAIFGTPVARRYGWVKTLLVFFASALGGAVLFAIFTLPGFALMLGASGGIAGLTGAACRFMFQPVVVIRHPETGEPVPVGRRTATLKELATHGQARFFIAFWLIFNAAVPFLPSIFGGQSGIAWQAHLGGFLVGLLIVPLLERRGGKNVRNA